MFGQQDPYQSLDGDISKPNSYTDVNLLFLSHAVQDFNEMYLKEILSFVASWLYKDLDLADRIRANNNNKINSFTTTTTQTHAYDILCSTCV